MYLDLFLLLYTFSVCFNFAKFVISYYFVTESLYTVFDYRYNLGCQKFISIVISKVLFPFYNFYVTCKIICNFLRA